jgi:hypothetical protein
VATNDFKAVRWQHPDEQFNDSYHNITHMWDGSLQIHSNKTTMFDNVCAVMTFQRSILQTYPDTTGPYLQEGNTNWNTGSDRTIKRDIQPIDGVLGRIQMVQVVRFCYKTDPEGAQPRCGVIAQDVASIFPEVVSEPTEVMPTWGVRYAEFVPFLLAGMRELVETKPHCGEVVLNGGVANVDIASVFGSAVALRCGQTTHVYTQNMSDWSAVRGTVTSDAQLNIVCQNTTSQDTVRYTIVPR